MLCPFHSNLSPILRGWCWGSEGDGDQEEKTEDFLIEKKKLEDWILIELGSYFEIVCHWDKNQGERNIYIEFGSAGWCDVR